MIASMTATPAPDTDHFFDDLDHSHKGSGWCSVAAIAWFAVLILVVGSVLIWIMVRPARTVSTKPGIATSIVPFGLKLPSNQTVPAADEFTVHLHDLDLDRALAQAGIPNLSDPTAHIHLDSIELDATLSSPLPLPVVMRFVPRVGNDGKITIQINDLTAGGIRILPLATLAMREAISQSLQTLINAKFSGKITKITLAEGELTAYVRP